MSVLLLSFIRVYKMMISPYMPGQCRFDPTCSTFAFEAVKTRGALRGSWLAVKRVIRCYPGGSRGYDPVPEKKIY